MKDHVVWRRAVTRIALFFALLLAVFAGAILVNQLRTSGLVSAAHRTIRIASPPAVPATPVPPAPPAPPVRAMLTVNNGPAVPYGAWINAARPAVRSTLTRALTGTGIRVQAEVAPYNRAFAGIPSAQSAPLTATTGRRTQATVLLPDLHNGILYHWRVRVRAGNGTVSPWSDGGIFGVSTLPPPAPRLVTATVTLGAWSQARTAQFTWVDSGGPVAIRAYQIASVRGAHPSPATLPWRSVQSSVLALSALAQGHWHVFARAIDLAGNLSAPVEWSFGVAVQGPPPPVRTAANPAPGAVTALASPTLSWTPVQGIAPVTSYQYTVARAGHLGAGAVWVLTTEPRLSVPGLSAGKWVVAVRSVDAAGNHSRALHWRFVVDRTPPLILAVNAAATSFTPPVETLKLSYQLSKTAVVTYTVTPAGGGPAVAYGTLGEQPAGKQLSLDWTGVITTTGHGLSRLAKVIPEGAYVVHLEATDAAGRQSVPAAVPVSVLNKRIVISISKDELWAYQGNTLLVKTPVTNGGPFTPTLAGIFHILGKYPNFVFHSPWPPGSPLWYPDSPVNYAMLYQASGGYFIHDAPWRTNYGPGSNSVAGTPGGNYTGSHGCTEVPLSPMTQLFSWADVGTLVQVVK